MSNITHSDLFHFEHKREKNMLFETLHNKSFENYENAKDNLDVSCFYCCEIYDSEDITEYTTEKSGKQTALCSKCGIDCVIPGQIAKCILREMHEYWFNRVATTMIKYKSCE